MRGLLCAAIAAAVLFAACKPFGGEFEEWQEEARGENGPYIVTFVPNGGSPAPDVRNIVKGKVTGQPTITRTGYTLDGWYTEAAFTKQWDFNKDTVTKDITLYAKWNGITYTVIYNKNASDATGTMENSSFTYDKRESLRTNTFTRPGYAFTGWAKTLTGAVEFTNGQSVLNLTTTPEATVTLYAVWKANAYTVRYDANGGSGTMTDSILLVGVAQSLRTNSFTRTGFTFIGWATLSSATTVQYANSEIVTNLTSTVGETKTLYAMWGYTVTFNANGGSGTAPAAQTAASRSSITLPSGSMTRTDYTFGGWNTNADGMGTNYSAGASYTVTGNTTLYVRWVYTVTFNINGGTGTTPAAQTANPGSSITLPGGSGLSKIGYTFGGWNTNVSGTGTTRAAGSSFTPSGNITLYAKWVGLISPDRIEYYWVDEHGSLVTTSGGAVTVAPGGTLEITARDEGYTARQWYLNGVDTGQSANSYTFPGTADGKHTVSLFVEKDGKLYNTSITIMVGNFYTVTFNANNATSGTPPAARTITTGSNITLPNGDGLTRTGYTFGGWNTNSSGTGTNYNAGASYTPNSNVTLYARWGYTVTFSANDGSGTPPTAQTIASGSSITLPSGSGLTRSGYVFSGWNINSSGTGTNYSAGSSYTPDGNVTLYARWATLQTSTVTIAMYDSNGDGWDSGGALRINKNGVQFATNVRVSSGSTNTYTFSVTTGDLIQLYWVAGSYQGENSFIVYYSDTPPSPTFTANNNNSWSGSNALVYRLRGTMDSISGGTLLGSFTAR
jgi:uncharacterized repeat protein (TIGR02543 family)